jgi:hypothetical protein
MKKLNILFLFFLLNFLSISLFAQNPPQAVILGDTTFCDGDSTRLFAVPGNFPEYLWSTGDTTASIYVKTGGVYSVRVIDSTGVMGAVSDPQTVVKYNLPSKPSISGIAAFCTNGQTLLTASPNNYPKYKWSTLDSIASIQVTQAATFQVSAIDINGCESPISDPVTVVEHPLPLKPTIMGDTAICEGDSALLGILQPFYQTYNWSNGGSTQSIWVTMGDSLTVSVVDSNGCQSSLSDLFIVEESMRPNPPAIGGDTVFCDGDSVMLSGPSGQSGYLWSTGATTQTIWVKASGTFALRVTNPAGCLSPFSLPWQISALSTPATPVISPFGTDSLHANSPARSYTWLYNGQAIADSTEIIPALQSGSYQVIAMNEGCISDTSEIFLFARTSLEDELEIDFAIYPNPASTELFILFLQQREASVSVMSLEGKKIWEKELSFDITGLSSLNISELADGYYFLRIGEKWQKFLVRK